MAIATFATSPLRPPVSSKKPQPAQPSTTIVKLLLEIPERIYERYTLMAAGRDIDEYLNEHLCETVGYDHSSAALHFNPHQAQRLATIAGRGMTSDPEEILKRLEPLVQVKIGEVVLSLDAQMLGRLSHRMRNGDATQMLRQLAMDGIRSGLGMALRKVTKEVTSA